MSMDRPAIAEDEQAEDPESDLNSVVLRGRLAAPAVEAQLPSGSVVANFRVVLPRAPTTMTRGSRQKSDWVVCSVWTAALRRRVSGWRAGDQVEVSGALRRRFSRSGAVSSLEVEALQVRRVRAAPRAEG